MEPKKFYEKIGVAGLSAMSNEEKTLAQIDFLKKFLIHGCSILDVGCGYGRLAIPLAKMGYQVKGIDISPNLLEEAKKQAKKENLSLDCKVGDMRALLYKDECFDAVICMWSTFSYMVTAEEQMQAINEMYRVLKKDGIAIIDLPAAIKRTAETYTFIASNIIKNYIMGAEHIVYLHTKETITSLLKNIKHIKQYEIKYQNIGGARRLCLFIRKSDK